MLQNDELSNLQTLMQLKTINTPREVKYKSKSVEIKIRPESYSDHSWGCLILLQYFIKKEKNIDELKAYKTLTYHDLARIEVNGRIILDDQINRKQIEQEGFEKLIHRIPEEMKSEYSSIFNEYQIEETRNSKFCKAISLLEPMINWFSHKSTQKEHDFNKEYLRIIKEKYLRHFPGMLNFFNNSMNHPTQNDELSNLQTLLQLKTINRGGEVKYKSKSGEIKVRPESSADHSWGCTILLQYFKKKVKDIDELKVYKTLTYHDLVEIESDDTFILDDQTNKKQKEQEGFERLLYKIPEIMRPEYSRFFNEYEKRETRDAKFCKAIDSLEPMIHWLDYKPAWKEHGFNEENLRMIKEKHLRPFPVMLDFFNNVMNYLIQNDYIEKK